jgi:hypothetical protein
MQTKNTKAHSTKSLREKLAPKSVRKDAVLTTRGLTII